MYTEKLGNTEQLHNKAHLTNVKINCLCPSYCVHNVMVL